MKTQSALAVAALAAALAAPARGEFAFDAGADLRIRQEIMDNVPGLPGGGVLSPRVRGAYKNHVRFRPRVWGQVSFGSEDSGKFRLYTRFTDEMRWYVKPHGDAYTFPDEVVLDNLFLEGKGLFGGFFDFAIGRQDIYGLYGLDHVFVDGTPGDGSRTVYSDMVRFGLKVSEESRLDFFALYNEDDNILRWGTDRGKHRAMTGLGGGAEPEMDDWGYGVIWGSRLAEWLPYQLFAMEKFTHSFYRKNSAGVEVKHPRTQRGMFGAKLLPQIDEEWSLQIEAMGQSGENGDHAALSGWSSYLGVNWKSSREGIRPFGKVGYHFMSGDDDAASEDGGHAAWDPMWARGVNDSELFLYGTHYGAAWWSNQHYLKLTMGADLGARHRVVASLGPLFAAAQDGLGGGDGHFKGFLSQIRYDFPLWPFERSGNERFEIFGHVLAEFFNPGDYYETDKPSYFVRWQVDFKF